MSKQVKWGILSAADIAGKFVDSHRLVTDSSIAAVGARTLERAQAFAAKYEILKAYGSYEELLADDEINAIYIATVHSHHARWVKAALEAGKHVLCEKSFALTPEEVEECMALAAEKKLFLMEAMWMRFLPIFSHVHRWMEEGKIGEVKQVRADFSILGENPRLFERKMGGGTLLDTGVYPLNFACMFLGYDPVQVTGAANVQQGVDVAASYTLRYENGGLATLNSAVNVEGPKEGHIVGSKGIIHLHHFWEAERATLWVNEEMVEEATAPHGITGFSYEIQEAVDCILAGKTGSERMPMTDTLKIARIQDTLFRQWGVDFRS